MTVCDVEDLEDTLVVRIEEFAPDEVTDEWTPSIAKPGISESYARRIVDAALDRSRVYCAPVSQDGNASATRR